MRFRLKLLAVRLVLLQERLWPRVWPLLILLLLFAGLAFFDVWAMVPVWLHVLGLAVLAAGLAAALHFLFTGWRWPRQADILARLEDNSGLANRPLRAQTDKMALGRGDAEAEALWARHLARQRAAARALRLRAPRANIPAVDPYGLRVAAVALALLGFFYAGADWRGRLKDGVLPEFGRGSRANLILDAWITPPDYVKGAPIFLPGPETETPAATVEVASGSVLSVRLSGARRAPTLRRTLTDRTSSEDWRVSLPLIAEGGGSYTIETPLEASATLDLFDGRHTVAKWPVTVVADRAPRIRFKTPPETTQRAQVRLQILGNDDYGIAEVTALLRLAPGEPPRTGASILDPSQPVMEEIALKGKLPKTLDETVLLDLSAHPWAGHKVEITLIAKDETGQEARSEPAALTLPLRHFTDPVAAAIIEQRSALATDAYSDIDSVAMALDALTLAPDRFTPDVTLYLGLRVAYFRLSGPVDRAVVKSVYDLLWDLALRVEDGDLSLAERQVREAQEALADALANDASDEEIAALTQALREAMKQLMSALAEAMQKSLDRGDYAALPPGAQSLSNQDLERMLDSIEQMAQSGARGAAQDLLAQMQAMLDRLQLGGGPQSLSEEQAAMADALDGLGDIVAEQRALMEETFRQSGRAAEPEQGDRPANELARDQAELRERLEELLSTLAESGTPPNDDFNKAAAAMGRAQDDLAAGDQAGAVPDQNEALSRLQRGMDQLSQQLAQSMGPGFSMGSAGGQGRDPLGRRNADDGTVNVPDEGTLQRARKILEDIKRRASDPARDKDELDYLDRLVPKF